MPKYNCVLCGDEHYDMGNNPEPLANRFQKCCDKCDAIFVTPARLLGLENLGEMMKFMDDAADDLPSFIIERQDKVFRNVYNRDYYESEYANLYENIETSDIDDEISKLEQYDMLTDALANAVENEYYEAAAKILKRIKGLEVV